MSMTPDEIEAERERFENEFKHLMDFSRCDDGEYRSNPTHAGFAGWRIRATIAHAREAELTAEIERLRQTLREYCDDDEVSSGFGSGCYSGRQIDEIRKRHGLDTESGGA